MKLPSKKQAQVLAFIKAYISANGYAPTVNEIKADLGVSSTNGVHQHLNALEAKGLISRKRAAARAIVVLEAPAQPAPVDPGEEAAPPAPAPAPAPAPDPALVKLWWDIAQAFYMLEEAIEYEGYRLTGADTRLKLKLIELRRLLNIPAECGENQL